ncbi:MAG: prepilin-type N-terminal cleavage/methylation domain-containing protein [Candidatus Saccharibacteria bacterium]
MKQKIKYIKNSAFTIVELIVVIVVIGIIATVSMVAYTGVVQRADAASLKTELADASNQLKAYHGQYGKYPVIIDDCPTPNSANMCLKHSDGTTFSYQYNNSVYPKTFTLIAIKNTTGYQITNDTNPVAVTITPFTAIAAISGTTTVGSTLTAGARTPSSATVSYQWQSATTSGGTYSNISGATSFTYVLTSNESGKYIKLIAVGSGIYTGTVSSAASAIVVNVNLAVDASGGTVTVSGNTRTHTFNTSGTFSITNGGNINVTIKGAGGGAGSPSSGWDDWGDPGTAGGQTSMSLSGVNWQAYGGGGGDGCADVSSGSDGANGSTNTPSGWTTATGGGSAGGSKMAWGGGWAAYGGNGGNGGSLVKTSLSVNTGSAYAITVGSGGVGPGTGNGNDGSVVISYIYN